MKVTKITGLSDFSNWLKDPDNNQLNGYELAVKSGVSPAQICLYKASKNSPSIDNIVKIVNCLGYELIIKPKK